MNVRPFALLARRIGALVSDVRGLATLEFAVVAPVTIGLFMTGLELANFTIVKMRVSQIALHVADNASRIGTNSLLTAPQISETQINDLFTGAGLQAGSINLYANGRVILSSLEPVANPNTTAKFKIRWQRCKGSKSHASSYGVEGANNINGMGPTGQVARPPDDGAVMYVEVAYDYQPLFSAAVAPQTTITDVAAMVVRNDRDYNGNSGVGIYNNENATASTCS